MIDDKGLLARYARAFVQTSTRTLLPLLLNPRQDTIHVLLRTTQSHRWFVVLTPFTFRKPKRGSKLRCRSSFPFRISEVAARWLRLPGHQCWLESRQTFLGQVRAPSSAPVRPPSGLRDSGNGEISGKGRRPTRRDWRTSFAIVSPGWPPRRDPNPQPSDPKSDALSS